MLSYKIDELSSNDRLMESLNKQCETELNMNQMRKMFGQFMNISNTYEFSLLAQSISYFISILKEIPVVLNEPFINRLMWLILEKILDYDTRKLAYRLISKMLKYDTEMIENLLNNRLQELVSSLYPSEFGLKFCTKLSTHRPELKQLFINQESLFFDLDGYEMNDHELKLYANFFSSLARNNCELTPNYFDFCHFLVTMLVRDEVPDDKARNSIIAALLTLIQASNDYINEMIERDTFILFKNKIQLNDELIGKNKEEIEQLKEKKLYMEDLSKREICNLIDIFTLLTKNHSEFILTNEFFDWFFCLYHQNSEFHQYSNKKVINCYLTFLGDLAFYNPKIFGHPNYLNNIFEILENVDEYHFKTKVCIYRLIYILFDRSSLETFYLLLNSDVHLILLQNISFTDISDRLMVLQTCYQIFKNCPEEKALNLYQFAKENEDFIDFLTGEQPKNDDSQKFANLILEQIQQFDTE